MAEPTFRRYWIKVADGIFYPQFDENGVEYEWQQVKVKPEAVLFVPFTPELVARVRAKCEIVDLPPIEILVAETVEWCRPCKIHLVPHMVCGFCGAELLEGIEATCPRCFATHHWYCDVCDEFKDPVAGSGGLLPRLRRTRLDEGGSARRDLGREAFSLPAACGRRQNAPNFRLSY